jgi:tRNA A37 threonylcarbamoyladenosine modification protein TsaB
MILYLDTTDNSEVELGVFVKDQLSKQKISLPHAENLAQAIEKFLSTHKLRLSDITKIAVRQGTGFFSRIRTGVVAANAIAYGLGIEIVPVTGEIDYATIHKAKGQRMIKPVYSGNPHITQPKKRKWQA